MLAELQRDFACALRGDLSAASRFGIDGAGIGVERRISVYRNHHRISLAAALAANFPTVVKVIGEDAFRTLAHAFLAIEPPRNPCVAEYGDGFPAFLEDDSRSRSLVYLGDVARLDRARNIAEHAEDLVTFTPEHLAGLDEPGLEALCLQPHPSLTLLSSPYPLLRIVDVASGAEEGVSLDAGGVDLMIWRRAGAVACLGLDRMTYDFVRALADGQPLGAAAEGLAPRRLAELLAATVLSEAFLAPQSF
jgi:hypothetical protein